MFNLPLEVQTQDRYVYSLGAIPRSTHGNIQDDVSSRPTLELNANSGQHWTPKSPTPHLNKYNENEVWPGSLELEEHRSEMAAKS